VCERVVPEATLGRWRSSFHGRPSRALPSLHGPCDRVARALLGCKIVSSVDGIRTAGLIVETEAYPGPHDPASHAAERTGRTERNSSMFGPAGTAYVYFTYGMHWCLNLVTGPPGSASAVLLRAGTVLEGVDAARRRRSGSDGAVADRDLARGPARLTRVLGVTGQHDGLDLLDPRSPLQWRPAREPAEVSDGPRVGVRTAEDRPWRFWLPDEPTVSAYRAGGRRRVR
jgi:DNA-3-methyladenine glycosylase